MARAFQRFVSLRVGESEFSGLRVTFRIKRTVKMQPNPATISIYNLSEDTRQKFKKGSKIILDAGYAEEHEQIYSGDVRTVTTRKEGADWVTRLDTGDGEIAYRTKRVNESIAKGTKIQIILDKLKGLTGLGPGNIAAKINAGDVRGALTEMSQGAVLQGQAFDEIHKLMRSWGYESFIDDGQLFALEPDETTTESAILLSPTTKLIGSPDRGEKGHIRVQSLLLPSARPGRRLKMDSRFVEGDFKILEVEHVGDIRGGDWYSNIEARPV